MKGFKNIKGKVVERLFLIIWPPWGEKQQSDLDISFGFVFREESNYLYIISIDKDELWSPFIYIETIPVNRYSWLDFYPRINMWMNAKNENMIIDKEYYEVTKSDLFNNILFNKIEDIELLKVTNIPEPFGVKLIFKDDYIISIPNWDGNTVESKHFNKNHTIEIFRDLGDIVYIKI